jgi:hypothetical protein
VETAAIVIGSEALWFEYCGACARPRPRARVLEICRLLISNLPFFYADVLLLGAFEYMMASAVDGNEELAMFDVGGCLCCKV